MQIQIHIHVQTHFHIKYHIFRPATRCAANSPAPWSKSPPRRLLLAALSPSGVDTVIMVIVDKIGFVFVVCFYLILEYDDQGVWMMNYARSKDGKCGVKTGQPVRF